MSAWEGFPKTQDTGGGFTGQGNLKTRVTSATYLRGGTESWAFMELFNNDFDLIDRELIYLYE